MLPLGLGLGKSIGFYVTFCFRLLMILHVHGYVSGDIAAVAEVRFCTFVFRNHLAYLFFVKLVDWVLTRWVVLLVCCCEEFIMFAEWDTTLSKSLTKFLSCSRFLC